MRIIVVVASIAMLTACSTPYQGMGLLGGVSASQIDANTLQISAKGNGFTSGATIEQYVLLKAAEETINHGFDFFQIVSASDSTTRGVIYVPGQSTSTTNGSATITGNSISGSSTTNTYTTPGTAFGVVKPGEDVMVKMYHGQRPADAPPNVYIAADVVKYLGPQIKR